MRYRNKDTGSEIETNCLIAGDSWEPVIKPVAEEVPEPVKKPKKASGKGGKKK